MMLAPPVVPLTPALAALDPAFYEVREPTPLPEPRMIAFNESLARELGLDPMLREHPAFLALSAGNATVPGVAPVAAVYSGHQFGVWAGQLGDGRAITLGELRTPSCGHVEWQLKGAGMTAFSRFADGRAVLRSTVREYLCSEAMHALGVPTTRALAIVGSPEPVYRERVESAAVLTRLAPSFVRFGSFEHFASRDEPTLVRALADYVIDRERPHLREQANPYLALFADVVGRTAHLMAQWTLVGFAHGVMNTDNMSILGLTLDYGPYGFLDAYDPGFICNHTDQGGRYAFDRQPSVALWNCRALAYAMQSLFTTDEANDELARFEPIFRSAYVGGLRAKLGLVDERDGDGDLANEFLRLLALERADYTLSWRALAAVPLEGDADTFVARFRERDRIEAWLLAYRSRLHAEGTTDDAARKARMNGTNPKYVLRNWIAQVAINAAEHGDDSEIARVKALLDRPFDDQPENEAYAAVPPEWARGLEVSCSS